MTDLFTIRDLGQAASAFAQLERYADRRDVMIDALDFEALEPASKARITDVDLKTFEAITYGRLYLVHLAQMEELGASLERDEIRFEHTLNWQDMRRIRLAGIHRAAFRCVSMCSRRCAQPLFA